jgi:hypothetical protein
MIRKVFIVIKLRIWEYAKTNAYAKRVYKGMVEKAAAYPDPLPSMADFKAHIDKQNRSINAWGDDSNHGSTKDKTDLQQDTVKLQQDMRSLKKYCEIMTKNDGSSFLAAGFEINKDRTAQPVPGIITDFKQQHTAVVGTGDIKGKWKRPEGAKSFNIYMTSGNTIIIPPDRSAFLKNVRTASFITGGLTPGAEYTFIIQSVGTEETENYFGVTLRAKF